MPHFIPRCHFHCRTEESKQSFWVEVVLDFSWGFGGVRSFEKRGEEDGVAAAAVMMKWVPLDQKGGKKKRRTKRRRIILGLERGGGGETGQLKIHVNSGKAGA